MLQPDLVPPSPRPPPAAADARRAEVLARLDEVMDPELDRSVAEMGFLCELGIDGGTVDLAFRLPTYWCSANFAFLMAEDMRAALERLPWVDEARVRLLDHFAARRINAGVAARLGFEDAFRGEAAGDLAAIRRAFEEKAFLGRQDRLVEALAAREGLAAALALTVAALERLADGNDAALRPLALRYLQLRRRFGGRAGPSDPAVVRLDGTPVAPADYPAHRREARRVRGAAEANAELCRIQLAARYAEAGTAPFLTASDEDEE